MYIETQNSNFKAGIFQVIVTMVVFFVNNMACFYLTLMSFNIAFVLHLKAIRLP